MNVAIGNLAADDILQAGQKFLANSLLEVSRTDEFVEVADFLVKPKYSCQTFL